MPNSAILAPVVMVITLIVLCCRTLAGSTIMLLTLPWLGSLILARVDLVHGQGVDERTSKFTIKSFWKQVSIIIIHVYPHNPIVSFNLSLCFY